MDLSTRRMATLEQVRAFVEGSLPVDYKPLDRTSTYAFVEDTLRRFAYRRLGKADKGVLRRFLAKSTGLSLPQVERLIRQYRDTGKVRDRRIANSGRAFPRRYLAGDIRLLAEVDEAYGQPQPDGQPGYTRVDTVHAWTSSTLATATVARASIWSSSSTTTAPACSRSSTATRPARSGAAIRDRVSPHPTKHSRASTTRTSISSPV